LSSKAELSYLHMKLHVQLALLPEIITHHCIRRWEFIPMGIRAIPIPIQGDSSSFPFPFPIVSSIPILMGFPWDSQWEWKSNPHDHLYSSIISFTKNTFLHSLFGSFWTASLYLYRTAALAFVCFSVFLYFVVYGCVC